MAGADARREAPHAPGRLLWIALAGLVAVHALLAYLLFDPKPFVGGDNAGYMALAEALRTGRGYVDLYLPALPKHAQYPPFYPIVLALIGVLGGGLIAFKALSAMFTAASVVVLFLLARSRVGDHAGLAVAGAFALNPVLLYYSHWVLSEAPFVFLTLLALWATEEMTTSNRRLILAVVAASLAYLTRAAGLPLVLALIVALAWRRDWKKLALVAPAALAVVGGWWLWGKLAASGSAHVYSSNFLLVNPYAPEAGYIGPGDLFTRTLANVRLYAVEVLPQSLAGVAPGGGVGLAALLASLLVVALALIAWVRDIRRVKVMELFTLLYAGLIFLWPQVWTDRRFLLPLLPVLLVHAAAGVVWCFDFLRAKRPVWILPAAGALLILLAVPDHIRAVSFNQRCMRFYRQGDSLACYPPAWRAFVLTADWVRENTDSDAIVVNRKPRLFYYFARRRGEVYPFTADDDQMLGFLNDLGADYVIVDALSGTTLRYLVPVIRSVPERFEPVHRVGEGDLPTYVLRYIRQPVSGDESGGGDAASVR
jgi:hypothetical protein